MAVTWLEETLELAMLQLLPDLLTDGLRYGLGDAAKFITDLDRYGLQDVIAVLLGDDLEAFSNRF